MKLCDACQNIDIRDLLQSFYNARSYDIESDIITRDEYISSLPDFQAHHSSLAALQHAGRTGCEFCEMIWDQHCNSLSRIHSKDRCPCRRYQGPIRFVICQESFQPFAQLCIVAMASGHKKEELAMKTLISFEICTANGSPRRMDGEVTTTNVEKALKSQTGMHIFLNALLEMKDPQTCAPRCASRWQLTG